MKKAAPASILKYRCKQRTPKAAPGAAFLFAARVYAAKGLLNNTIGMDLSLDFAAESDKLN